MTVDAARPPVLELNGLGVSFGQRMVLDDINLSLLPDGIDVLMGPGRSGKSTLFRTLAGLYEGHALHKHWGTVTFQGGEVAERNRPVLIQQHARMLNLSLLQVLLEPLRKVEHHSPAEWRRVGLELLATHGLDEFAGQADQPLLDCDNRARRSVPILAQLLLNPGLLLLDEPTDGLSDADAEWLLAWLRRQSSRSKLWVILHDQRQARRLADRIALVGAGRLLAQQAAAEFYQHPANEWVEQFVRTGRIELAAPDAPREEPRVEASIAVTQEMPSSAAQHSQQANLAEIEADQRSPVAEHAVIDSHKPVEIPTPSREGVALAAAVGDFILRDASAPRGFNWVVPGKLAGCAAPVDHDLALLARVGVTRLVTLTEADLDQEALRRNGLANIHLPVLDGEAPSIGQAHMLLVRMQRWMESGQVVAVHCHSGLGRTGAILAAWMIREGGLTALDSMSRLRRIEHGFIQSEAQEDFLHRYEADLTQRLL